jgi:outer membrane protein assembly factor BamB
MNGTPAGGDWPRTPPNSWLPTGMDAPVQHLPVVAPLGARTYVYLASQDGYAYAFDAHTGAKVWTSNDGADEVPLGTMLQADPVGLFAAYGATTVDRLFVGTRNGSGANQVHALDPTTGEVMYSFDNAADGGMGIITGMSVDYRSAPKRLYIANRALSPGGYTLWCMDVTATGATVRGKWALGDIDGTPVAWSNRIYVGTNAGLVYCIDPGSAAEAWSYGTGDGPVKGYIFPNFGTPLRLYLSTSTKVWALDAGGGVVSGWPVTTVAGPTPPQLLFASGHVLVGSSDGRLYQIEIANPGGAPASELLGSGQLGMVAVDNADPANLVAIAGSTAGAVYAVKVPL